jgi:hypothetical protein
LKYLLLLPLLLFLIACNQIENSPADIVTFSIEKSEIESPLRNICQSGDLDPDFPKCELR